MIVSKTEVPGVHVLDVDQHEDARGTFARIWCAREATANGLEPRIAQASLSCNRERGTLRGLHYQRPPHAEVKVVRCVRGAVFDVALDLRKNSPTFRRWVGVELSADNGRALYIPEGCAHGFMTLERDSEILYQMSSFYEPDAGAGVRWDDSAFGITWPLPVSVIGPRDAGWSDFRDEDSPWN
ncbi:MAG TPA: dTDP-4-dehydrorhamnose 3,5-epimerase [Gemmatimonadaceae bacterium]|nr:dTDP-4-dehydrorhamnose 3,5-epimerase [Gemmatimonadaceae bacterium]